MVVKTQVKHIAKIKLINFNKLIINFVKFSSKHNSQNYYP